MNRLKPAITRLEFESWDEELNFASTQSDPHSNRSPEPEIDPQDELIFSSLDLNLLQHMSLVKHSLQQALNCKPRITMS